MTETTELIADLQAIHDGDAWHGPSLHAILTNVSAAQAAAQPLPGVHSIWELTLHIASWEDFICRRLRGEALTEPPTGDFPAVTDTSETAWQQARTAFDQTHAEFLQQLAKLPEALLDRLVTGKDYTVRAMLRGMVRHHVYHAGQIALLKRGLG